MDHDSITPQEQISVKIGQGGSLTQNEIDIVRKSLAREEDTFPSLDESLHDMDELEEVKSALTDTISILPKFPNESRSLPLGTSAKIFTSIPVRQAVRKATNEWHYDVTELENLTQKRSLSVLLISIFQNYDLYDSLNIDTDQFKKFSRALETSYKNLPYHNALHAATVLQLLNLMLSKGRVLEFLAEHFDLDETNKSLILASMFIAAAGHDSGHPGRNNDFLVKTESETALEFNDISCNENRHAKNTWTLLSRYDILHSFSNETKQFCRIIILNCILKTDMKSHLQVLRDFSRVKVNFCNGSNLARDDLLIILQMCLKSADLAHLCMPWKVTERWTLNLEEEMFRQGDVERLNGMNVSPLMDRNKPGILSAQPSFMKCIITPNFKSLTGLFPDLKVMLDTLKDNSKLWSDKIGKPQRTSFESSLRSMSATI